VGVTDGLTFVDTNVLVHAEDGREPARRGVAVRVLRDLWESGLGVVSTQVLQEFYDTGTRKLKMRPALRRDDAAQRGPAGRPGDRRADDPEPVRPEVVPGVERPAAQQRGRFSRAAR
jgi:predicted nucleic acid-binding protein